ncbi:MAG: hypothetical protein NZL83_03385 [Candidatus Absconditabacterales bacterium]|nr:hypothetical protein [Candidatus Absconditabacterales bacterium]
MTIRQRHHPPSHTLKARYKHSGNGICNNKPRYDLFMICLRTTYPSLAAQAVALYLSHHLISV